MKKTVLIIDDHGALRQVLAYDLEKAGYRSLMVPTGEQGIIKAKEEKPDLILLDVMMPGIDGYETCKRLKKIPETSKIPIIMVTAKSQREDILTGLKSGAVNYIVKPFKFEDIYGKVKDLIGEPDKE